MNTIFNDVCVLVAAAFALTLVYRLLNPLSFAAGQLAVFQGASEVPISVSLMPKPGANVTG